MLEFSRSSKYGVIDNNLLAFYNTTNDPEEEKISETMATNHGEGVVDVLNKLKEPAKKLVKELVKGAAKAGAQELGSFALRKIVDKVTKSSAPKNKDGDEDENDFLEEEDINAKIRKKVLKDLQILSSNKSNSESKSKSKQEIKSVLDEELKKILNITTPQTKHPNFNIRIGE